MTKEKQFTFEISLSVLEHLGRNLYRSFTTVLGEAISNAWDADAKNVQIYLDRENNSFCIMDDGIGMTSEDFQEKFLKIGYSKRIMSSHRSPEGRPYIGRKGIGKLALLSCSEKVSIKSKIDGGNYVGGMIDNSALDQKIREDEPVSGYKLNDYDDSLFKPYTQKHSSGTIIYFESIKDGIHNTEDFLKKIIALYFRFSLKDPTFNIYLNDEPITLESLKEIGENTQFVWNINSFSDPYLTDVCVNQKEILSVAMNNEITGFIASVKKPKDRNIYSTGEKVGVDLFVNGRLRETDILKHIPSARVPENYLYGQIHFDALDGDDIDRFTSSREGVLSDDPKYKSFLEELKGVALRIIDQWDELRDKYREDGDSENLRMSKKERRAKELANETFKEFVLVEESAQANKVNEWCADILDDAKFNFESYADCFVSENLLRRHIEENGSTPTSCTNTDPSGKTCMDRYDPKNGNISLCEYCKGEKGKQSLQQQKSVAGTSIQIRNAEDNLLMYLDYIDLAKIINNKILRDEDKPYKPLRNSVMHTSVLTDAAKTKLRATYDNIKAMIKILLS